MYHRHHPDHLHGARIDHTGAAAPAGGGNEDEVETEVSWQASTYSPESVYTDADTDGGGGGGDDGDGRDGERLVFHYGGGGGDGGGEGGGGGGRKDVEVWNMDESSSDGTISPLSNSSNDDDASRYAAAMMGFGGFM